jgi:mannose-6-phosphate isomerase class I
MDMVSPLLLECGVQHYDWGQRGPGAFIPRLLGIAPEEGRAYAELWIGAHPMKPARARTAGGLVPLPDLIDASPDAILGPASVARFGKRLPFLLKVLAAERMLSIQAHPNARQAAEGFAREEADGVPRDAERRSYKDASHKPELIVALTPFVALSGFRPLPEARAAFAAHAELAPVLKAAGAKATIESLYLAAVSFPPADLDALLAPLITRLDAADRARPFGPARHEHWLLRADRQFSRGRRRDRGLLSMLTMNLVHLAPGQGLFLGAGELHSYLEGVGVELMASSDNVLRGGLTSKHVDALELRRVLTFHAGPATPIEPTAAGVYSVPADELELTARRLDRDQVWGRSVSGPELLLVTEGSARLLSTGSVVPLSSGSAVLIPARLSAYEIRAEAGGARIFRAALPTG